MNLNSNNLKKKYFFWYFTLIFKTLKLLKKKRIIQLLILFFITVIGVSFDVLSISTLIPLLNLLINIDSYLDDSFILSILKIFGISSKDSITLFILLIFVILLFISYFFKLIIVTLNSYVSASIGHDLNALVFKNSIKQNFIFYKNNNSNIILANLQKTETTRGIFLSILEMCVSFIVIVTIGAYMIYLDPIFVVICSVVILLLYFIIFFFLKKKILNNSRLDSLITNSRVKLVQETSYIIREIILKNLSNYFLKKFINMDLIRRKIIFKNALYVNFPNHIMMLVASILIIIFIYSFSLKEDGLTFNIAILGALIMSSQRLVSSINTVYGAVVFLKSSFYQLNDVYLSLRSLEKSTNKKRISKKINFQNKIQILNGYFNFKGKKNYLFKNINLIIKKGFTYFIQGNSGFGKTTLIDLITGLLKLNKGTLKIDNQVLSEKNIYSWQKKISYVSQESTITDNSIIENVALGEEDKKIDINRVYHVCKISEIYDDIIKFEDNFSTKLGEQGKKISGGQRQRIAIARALYTDSDIIILDEATNALDIKTEDKIFKNIKKFYLDKTIIIVSHRLSNKKYADFVISVKSGQIKMYKTY
jgi:ABC-type bacteriocin/lantibiotic exporter with double-glycine peptidase domain